MDLEKSIKELCCCICDAIRRLFRPSTPAVGAPTPNGGAQLGGAGAPIKIQPDEEPPAPKPIAVTPNPSETPSPRQETPLETPAPTTHSEETNQKKPPNKGGRRGQDKRPNPPTNPKPPPETKPELICREVRNQWQIFLALPQDPNTSVSQSGTRLSPNNGGEYPLSDFSQTLTVNMTENGHPETIKLTGDDSPLIFKLRKNWKGDGRKAKHVSNGCYVVFAPCKWQRTGNAPITPEECSDNKFLAHYFSSADSGEPDGFDKYSSFIQQKRFLLEGKTVADDSDMGDLFVGTSLELADANNNNWEGVSWVRVGEEGDGKWGENFKPASKNLTTVLETLKGWFYVRIYDENVEMIDGFAFRRLMNLEAILSNGIPFSSENIIAPGTNGHTETTLQFTGKIQVKSNNPHITVGDDNTAIVAPNPDCDETQWTLSNANGQVKVCVHLPRIWWRMGNEADKWQDTAFTMSREEFRNNRESVIIMRLPPVARKICVGLDSFNLYDGAREYPTRHNKNDNTKQAEFRLRDFRDHKQISECSSKEATLRVRCGEAECTLIRVPADMPRPEPKPSTPEPPQKLFLRPSTGNKRFSLSELSESGLTVAEAKHLRIAVDGRRKTKHRANTDILRNKEKLCQLSKK